MLARVNRGVSRVILGAILAIGLPLGLLAATPRAQACSCAMPSFEEQRASAAAIFEGRAIAFATSGDDEVAVTFRVTQAWRGVAQEQVTLRTASNGASCGYAFTVGEHYLVYASSRADVLHVSLCSRTARMDDASEDRQLLGSGTIPVDVVDDDELDTPREPPATRVGCASCAVGATRPPLAELGIALVLVGGAWARRHRRASRETGP